MGIFSFAEFLKPQILRMGVSFFRGALAFLLVSCKTKQKRVLSKLGWKYNPSKKTHYLPGEWKPQGTSKKKNNQKGEPTKSGTLKKGAPPPSKKHKTCVFSLHNHIIYI